MKPTAWIALAAVFAIALAGCQDEPQPGEGRRHRIALIYKATTNPFFQAMEKGAREKADELGVALEVAGIPSETDVDRQANLVRNMLNRQVEAVIIAPASSIGIVTPLLRAQEQKVPIINIDNRISKEEAAKQGLKVATFIGPDNFEGAKKVGTYACDLIKKRLNAGEKGRVLILRGIDGVENAEARRAGFEAAAKDAGVEVAGSESAHWHTDEAQRVTSALLAAKPGVHGVLCANDKMALGAIAAVKARGKIGRIVIVGYDNIDLAREAMKRGDMHATIEQNPAMMGALGVECALKALGGQALPEVTPVPVELITVDDVNSGAKQRRRAVPRRGLCMDDLDQFVPYSPEGPTKAPRRRLKGATLALVAMACGLLSLPAMVVPGLGLGLGLTGFVLGCRALSRLKGEATLWVSFSEIAPLFIVISLFTSPRGRAILGISFGLVGAGLNVLVWYLIWRYGP